MFEKLKGRDVVLWHLTDDATMPMIEGRFTVLSWVSITLCAFELAARMGWRKFDVWGWDGCLIDGQDHAAPQPHGGQMAKAQIGDAVFDTTPGWMLEAQTACTVLAGFPFPVHVHGPGLVPAMLRTYLPKRVVTDD